MTIVEMKNALAQGRMTSVDLVKQCLDKIEEKKGLNAVIQVNESALNNAKDSDEDEYKGLIDGIPILLKDNINTGDRMPTSAGSVALAKNMSLDDAPAAYKLRLEGAIFVGKTNMTEFANYMCDFRLDERMPNGYSSRGGQTLHPTHNDADPSGSSTGSAVAVAAGLVPAAIGSETYGSIISPSQQCGVVGIKPTDGLVSKEGVIPISYTLDTLGPITNSVEDAALILSIMSGKSYEMNQKPQDITMGIVRTGADNEKWPPKGWIQANEALIPIMKKAGITAKDLPDGELAQYAPGKGGDSFVFPIMRYEFQRAINNYLDGQNSPKNIDNPKNLKEIIAYNIEHKDTALKYGQGNLIAASEITDSREEKKEYAEAMEQRKTAIKVLDNYFNEHKVDVLMLMSAHCGLAAAAGFPSITFPIGKDEKGLPIGCLFMARRFDEDILLAAAKMVESGLKQKG